MKKRILIPDTVGELIDLLKQFPRDRELNVYKRETYDNGSVYDESAYHMELEELDEYGGVELTIL